jgi:hypothetical protein
MSSLKDVGRFLSFPFGQGFLKMLQVEALPSNPEELVPLTQAAAYLGGYPRSYRLARSGKLRARKVGGVRFVTLADIERFLEAESSQWAANPSSGRFSFQRMSNSGPRSPVMSRHQPWTSGFSVGLPHPRIPRTSAPRAPAFGFRRTWSHPSQT